MDSSRALRMLMARYGIDPESRETTCMLRYLELLDKWNLRINLTASTAWRSIGALFEEAVWAASIYPPGAISHLDIGSGAGFPAVPMRILLPQVNLRLVESRARRAAFLESVVTDVKLEGSEVICRRVEDYLKTSTLPQIDIVSWKGLRLSKTALALLVRQCRANTLFWLFHGNVLPFEDREDALLRLQLHSRLQFPGSGTRALSIFRLRPGTVSRETKSPDCFT